jgi:hypothetical protein
MKKTVWFKGFSIVNRRDAFYVQLSFGKAAVPFPSLNSAKGAINTHILAIQNGAFI